MPPSVGTLAGMRRWLLVVLLALTACGGSKSPDPAAHFAAAVKGAYTAASAETESATPQVAAGAWETFAVKVETMRAGADARQQGLIVAAAKQAAATYRSQVAVRECQIRQYTSGGPACGQEQSADSSLRELRALVDSL